MKHSKVKSTVAFIVTLILIVAVGLVSGFGVGSHNIGAPKT